MSGGVFTLGGTTGALGLASLIKGTLSAEVPSVRFWGHYEKNNLNIKVPSPSIKLLGDVTTGVLRIEVPAVRSVTTDSWLHVIPPSTQLRLFDLDTGTGILDATVPAVEWYREGALGISLPEIKFDANDLHCDPMRGILNIIFPSPLTLDTRDNILRLYEIPPFFSQFREEPVGLPLPTSAPAVSMEGEVYSPNEGRLSAETPSILGHFHYSIGLLISIPTVEALLEGAKSISRFEVPAVRLSMAGYTLEELLYEALVMNTRNMALSRYSGLPFQCVFELGGKVYGCGPNGLYELSGDADGDSSIEATIRFPELDIRKEFVKRLSHAFLTMRGKGTMKVSDGSDTYSYSIREVSELDEVRVKFGKGLRARFLTIEINNKEGSNIEIDTLSIFADRETRRRR